MERLTKRGFLGITYNERRKIMCSTYCDNCSRGAGDCDTMKDMINRLAELEDLEEQGLLVRLPDDKKIYQISSRWTECSECGSRFDEYSCSGCEYDCDSKKEYYIYTTNLSSISAIFYIEQLGKTLFLTSEEAEKKLEEMKNG